jgi:preprotein translocase subunit Sec61beta
MRIGLYTDESPGLKVDPVVVLVLSLVFIFSVVALHSMFFLPHYVLPNRILISNFIVIAKITRKLQS